MHDNHSRLGSALVVLLLVTVPIGGCRPDTPMLPKGYLLATIDGYGLSNPDWSPEGSEIVVQSRAFSDQSVPSSLVGVDVQTGSARELVNVSIVGRNEPHWATDGSAVLFEEGCELFAVSSVSSSISHLGEGCSVAPAPSGDQIATQAPPGDPPVIEIVILPSDGERESINDVGISIFRDNDNSGLGETAGMDWSASNQIAFSYCPHCLTGPINHNILVVDTSGTLLLRLDPFGTDDEDPSWSFDGAWLSFVTQIPSAHPTERTVVLTSRDGRCMKQLVSADYVSGVDWSSTGEELAITVSNELWIVSLQEALGITYSELSSACQ